MSGAPDDVDNVVINVWQLALSCGHLVTAVVDGWYPVSVSCCDRLGGSTRCGDYVPFASKVDFVPGYWSYPRRQRPAGTRRQRTRIIARRSRTDSPCRADCRWIDHTAGRFPAWVGGIVQIGPHSPGVPVDLLSSSASSTESTGGQHGGGISSAHWLPPGGSCSTSLGDGRSSCVVPTAVLTHDTGVAAMVHASAVAGVPRFRVTGSDGQDQPETRDRIRAAIINSRVPWPDADVTVHISQPIPAPMSSATDLAAAAAVLGTTGEFPAVPDGVVVVGELGLDGEVRPVSGITDLVNAAVTTGATTVVVALGNAEGATQVGAAHIIVVASLTEFISWVKAAVHPDFRAPGDAGRHGWRPHPAALKDGAVIADAGDVAANPPGSER